MTRRSRKRTKTGTPTTTSDYDDFETLKWYLIDCPLLPASHPAMKAAMKAIENEQAILRNKANQCCSPAAEESAVAASCNPAAASRAIKTPPSDAVTDPNNERRCNECAKAVQMIASCHCCKDKAILDVLAGTANNVQQPVSVQDSMSKRTSVEQIRQPRPVYVDTILPAPADQKDQAGVVSATRETNTSNNNNKKRQPRPVYVNTDLTESSTPNPSQEASTSTRIGGETDTSNKKQRRPRRTPDWETWTAPDGRDTFQDGQDLQDTLWCLAKEEFQGTIYNGVNFIFKERYENRGYQVRKLRCPYFSQGGCPAQYRCLRDMETGEIEIEIAKAESFQHKYHDINNQKRGAPKQAIIAAVSNSTHLNQYPRAIMRKVSKSLKTKVSATHEQSIKRKVWRLRLEHKKRQDELHQQEPSKSLFLNFWQKPAAETQKITPTADSTSTTDTSSEEDEEDALEDGDYVSI